MLPRGRRGWIITIAAVLAVVAGVGAWFAFFSPAPIQDARQTLIVSTSTLKQTISATGTLDPAQRADLSLPDGTVASVDVAVGDKVTAGQQLATIDDTSLRIALQSARADLTAARANLADLEDSDASDSAINSASATVQVRVNAVTQAEANLAAATLKAPFDGIVAEVGVAVGDTSGNGSGGSGSGSAAGGSMGMTGSSSSSSSSAAIVLISDGTFTVSTSVSNSDVPSIERGMQAVITATGASEEVYGTVASVGVMASSSGSSGSTSFPVEIKVTGTHTDLLPGSSVSVEIVIAQLSDVIAVPSQALTTTDGTTTVTKLVNGAGVATTVTAGETISGQTVITEGLAVGDQITYEGFRLGGGTGGTGAGSGQNGFPQGGFPEGGFPGGELPGGGQFPGGGGFPGGGQGGTGRGNR